MHLISKDHKILMMCKCHGESDESVWLNPSGILGTERGRKEWLTIIVLLSSNYYYPLLVSSNRHVDFVQQSTIFRFSFHRSCVCVCVWRREWKSPNIRFLMWRCDSSFNITFFSKSHFQHLFHSSLFVSIFFNDAISSLDFCSQRNTQLHHTYWKYFLPFLVPSSFIDTQNEYCRIICLVIIICFWFSNP